MLGSLTRKSLPMIAALGFAATWAFSPSPATASEFYEGKNVTFITSDLGGSYDAFARILARHLPDHIPGAPVIVVQTMPGAGGLRLTNWLYNAAPKDGLTIGMINNTLAFDPLYGNKQAQFDATKLNWLGTPSKETGLFIVWHTVPVNSIEDAKKRQLVLSATGSGSTPAFFARVLASIFDLKIKIVPGYTGQAEAFVAMERGENDGNASPFWSSLNNNYPTWVPEKKIKVLAYYGATRIPEIPGPYVFDLIKDPNQKALMEIAVAGLSMGRPVTAPPNVESSKIVALRRGFEATFKDSAYLADCTKAKLDCSQPSSGEDMLTFVKKIYASPKDVVEKISAIYMEGQKT